MPVDFLSAGASVLSWGATYLVHSTVLLGGAWMLLKWKRSVSHSFRESLWKTALVGGVVTASMQMMLPSSATFGRINIAISGFRSQPDAPNAAHYDDADVVPVAVKSNLSDRTGRDGTIDIVEHDKAETDRVFWVVTRAPADEVASLSPESSSVRRAATPMMQTARTWRKSGGDESRRIPMAIILTVVVGLSFVAIGMGTARCLCQSLSLRRKLRRCSPISTGPARMLLDALRRHVPRAPEVCLFSDPDDPEPAAFGIRQWMIVLPERAADDLPEDELRALLAHELAHLVRGDSNWLCVSRILCSCLAFQPLNHLARREWQRAAEFLCDEWAVSRTGTRLALARCLAEVAGWRLSGQPSAALLAATGRKSSLADRIERLLATADMNESRNELRLRRRMFVAAAILLGPLVWCAPRVLLAVAAPESARPAELQGNVRVTDAAKPQASGESPPATGKPLESQITLSPGEATTEAHDAPSVDPATLLESLDRELSALDAELKDLEPLLWKGDTSPPVRKLADRIRVEIVRLTVHRDALRAHWNRSVP